MKLCSISGFTNPTNPVKIGPFPPTAPGTRNPASVGTGALPGPQLTLNTM